MLVVSFHSWCSCCFSALGSLYSLQRRLRSPGARAMAAVAEEQAARVVCSGPCADRRSGHLATADDHQDRQRTAQWRAEGFRRCHRPLIRFAGATLDHIDSPHRVSDIVVIAGLLDAGYMPWRTRAEQA